MPMLALVLLAVAVLAMPAAADERIYVYPSRLIDRLQERLDELETALDRQAGEMARLRRELEAARTPHLVIDGRRAEAEAQEPPATFVLGSGRLGRPEATEIDRAALDRRCADADGCLALLGLAGVVDGDRALEIPVWVGPCALHLDAESGAWSVSAGCGGTSGTGQWGWDGDTRLLGDGAEAARTLISLAGACLLTEAGPTRRRSVDGPAALGPDTTRGLFLVATSAEWHLADGFPTDLLPEGARFDCRLTVRD